MKKFKNSLSVTGDKQLLPSCPEIKINGYTAEFKDWGLDFNNGCARIGKELFINLQEVFDKSNTGNKAIMSVKIGSGNFTVKQITEIAEYYKNQKS